MSPGRRVSLIVCSATGDLVGELPEITVEDPWWPEAQPVVEAVRARFGIDILVLRLLRAEHGLSSGGAVSYLVELIGHSSPAITNSSAIVDFEDHPLRAPWARPGGVRATIAWADGALAGVGRPRIGPAVQVKTWNLSSILRLPTAAGDVWCKSVPPFLVHEGAILGLVGAEEPTLVPPLLAADPATGTVLLEDVPGSDDWGAPEPRLLEMVGKLVRLQARWIGRTDDLLGAGLPDRRAEALTDLVVALVARSDVRARLTTDELGALDALVSSLPRRFAELRGCGLPDTLIDGDFHQGNWRFDGQRHALLDWGDSGVGHPMLDLSAFEERLPGTTRAAVCSTWFAAWRAEVPHAEPERAADLIAPIASLLRAAIYQGFLDGIEPSERRYHEADVPDWLRHALADAEA